MSLIPVNESLSSEEHTQSAPCPELCPPTLASPNPIENIHFKKKNSKRGFRSDTLEELFWLPQRTF